MIITNENKISNKINRIVKNAYNKRKLKNDKVRLTIKKAK